MQATTPSPARSSPASICPPEPRRSRPRRTSPRGTRAQPATTRLCGHPIRGHPTTKPRHRLRARTGTPGEPRGMHPDLRPCGPPLHREALRSPGSAPRSPSVLAAPAARPVAIAPAAGLSPNSPEPVLLGPAGKAEKFLSSVIALLLRVLRPWVAGSLHETPQLDVSDRRRAGPSITGRTRTPRSGSIGAQGARAGSKRAREIALLVERHSGTRAGIGSGGESAADCAAAGVVRCPGGRVCG